MTMIAIVLFNFTYSWMLAIIQPRESVWLLLLAPKHTKETTLEK